MLVGLKAEFLSLGFKPLKIEDIKKLGGFLHTLKCLDWLDLQNCKISNDHIEVLNAYAVGQTEQVRKHSFVACNFTSYFRNVILVCWTCPKTLNAAAQR